MQTPEPLTMDQLYKLCELAKCSPVSPIAISREELWALVEMAKQVVEEREECARLCDLRASKKGKDDQAVNEAEVCAALIRARAPTDENGNARPFGE